MASNLLFIREQLQITKKFISRLLNVSVYTYIGYEKDRLIIPTEILIMLSEIYRIPVDDLLCCQENISQQSLTVINQAKQLSTEKKEQLLIKNLTGNSESKFSYRDIAAVKAAILKEIKSEKVPHSIQITIGIYIVIAENMC